MFNINPMSQKPIYEQITEGIKLDISKGIINAGDKLPSIREYASMLRITPNTVARAYRELEHMGIIQTVQGKGVYVLKGAEKTIKESSIEKSIDEIKKAVDILKQSGVPFEKVINHIEEIWKKGGGRY